MTRIKTIQIIANFPEESKKNDKSRFVTRVHNIQIGLNDFKKLI